MNSNDKNSIILSYHCDRIVKNYHLFEYLLFMLLYVASVLSSDFALMFLTLTCSGC